MGLLGWFGAQMRKPEGWGGNMMCHILVWHHAGLIRWTVDLMNVQPGDRILDIGCGNGLAVQKMAEQANNGFVAGIDYSQVSVDLSQKRNAAAIEAGKVAISLGDVKTLPYEDQNFDKISAIESFYYWEDYIAGLEEAKRVLKPGGRLVIIMELTKDLPNLEKNLKLGESLNCPIFSGQEVVEMLEKTAYKESSYEMKPGSKWLCIQAVK